MYWSRSITVPSKQFLPYNMIDKVFMSIMDGIRGTSLPVIMGMWLFSHKMLMGPWQVIFRPIDNRYSEPFRPIDVHLIIKMDNNLNKHQNIGSKGKVSLLINIYFGFWVIGHSRSFFLYDFQFAKVNLINKGERMTIIPSNLFSLNYHNSPSQLKHFSHMIKLLLIMSCHVMSVNGNVLRNLTLVTQQL